MTDCADECDSTAGCTDYSFCGNVCWLFSSCTERNTDEGCFTSAVDCPLEPVCYEAGECMGTGQIANIEIQSVDHCHMTCEDEANCAWFTYHPPAGEELGRCSMWTDCDISASFCPTCNTSEVSCTRDIAQMETLMIVGGTYNRNKVIVKDLYGKGLTCEPVSDLPGLDYAMVGTYLNGEAMVCGGYSNELEGLGQGNDKCYTLDPVVSAVHKSFLKMK